MAINEDKWFEVWYSEGTDVLPTWLLIVTPNPKRPTNILIVDPLQKNSIVFEAKDYEEAVNWLLEDEYSLVDGRQFDTDIWAERIRAKESNSSA